MSNLLSKASLILTPTSYGVGSVASVVPTDGSGDFSFERDSIATRVNESGLIEEVKSFSEELIDYSTLTSTSTTFSQDVDGKWVYDDGGNGFLSMPSITANVGDVFNVRVEMSLSGGGDSNFRITKGNAQTLLFNYTDFPDGVTEFQATVTGIDGFLDRIFFPASLNDVPNTLVSLSLKKLEEKNVPRINYENGCGSWLFEPQSTNLYLNSETLSTQTITTTANEYSVSFYGTGTITFSGTYTGSLIGTGLNDRVTATFTATSGTLTSTISGTVTKAQIEQLSFATSYIPTDGSTVTRNQDVCTGSGSTSLIDSTEGVLYTEIARDSNDGFSGGVQINDGSVDNSLRLFFNQDDTISVITRVGGAANVVKTARAITSSTAMNKFALVWKLNDYKLYYNGSVLWSDTSAPVYPVGTLNNLELMNNSIPFNGTMKALAVWKEVLTDAELISLTTI